MKIAENSIKSPEQLLRNEVFIQGFLVFSFPYFLFSYLPLGIFHLYLQRVLCCYLSFSHPLTPLLWLWITHFSLVLFSQLCKCVCGNAAVRMRPSLKCPYRWWFVFSLALSFSLMVFSLAPCLPSLSRSFLHNHLFKRFLAVPGGSNYRHRQAL